MTRASLHRFTTLLLPVLLAWAPGVAGAHPGPHQRIAALTLALERNPKDAGAWVERAAEHVADGRPAEALRDLDRAHSLAPGRADLSRVRGDALLALGRAAEAEASLARALDRAPGSGEALRLRARARLALGRPREAAADLARCVELSPAPSPDDFLEWSRALAAAGPGSGAALAALDRGLATLGASASLVEEAVALECARGAWEDALARIERHAAAWGSRAALRARRGDVLRAAGRELEAQAEFSAALAELESAVHRRGTAPGPLELRLRAALRDASREPGRP